jgi:hypothetical protein
MACSLNEDANVLEGRFESIRSRPLEAIPLTLVSPEISPFRNEDFLLFLENPTNSSFDFNAFVRQVIG